MKKFFPVFFFLIGSAVFAPAPHSLLFAASPLAGPPALAPGPLPAIQPNFSAPLIPLAKGARVAPLCDPASPVPCLQQWMGRARPMAVHTGAGGIPSYRMFAPVMLMEKFIRKDANKVKWDGWRLYSSSRRKGGRGNRRQKTQYYVNKAKSMARRVTVAASGLVEKVVEGQAALVDVNALDRIADKKAEKAKKAEREKRRSAREEARRASGASLEKKEGSEEAAGPDKEGDGSEEGAEDSVSDYYGKPAPDSPVLERDKAAQIARQSARQMKTGDAIEREEDRRLQRARQRRQFEQLDSDGQKASAEARKALDKANQEKSDREQKVTDERERRLKERKKIAEAMTERGRIRRHSEIEKRQVMERIRREAEAKKKKEDAEIKRREAEEKKRFVKADEREANADGGQTRTREHVSGQNQSAEGQGSASAAPSADEQPVASPKSADTESEAEAGGGSQSSDSSTGDSQSDDSSQAGSADAEPIELVTNQNTQVVQGVADPEAAQAGCAELHSQIHETEAQAPCIQCTDEKQNEADRAARHKREGDAIEGVIEGDDSLTKGFEQLNKVQRTSMISKMKEWLVQVLPEVSKRVKGKILTVDKKDDKGKITKVCSLAHDYSLKHIVNNFNNTKENKGCKPMTFERFFPELYCKSCNQGIPPEIMLSVMSAESAGKCLAEGDQGNSVGLFQINSETQSCNGNAKGSQENKKCLLNLENNLKYGMQILSDKFQSVNGESPVQSSGACPSWAKTDSAQKDRWRRAVSAYNSGEGWLNRAVESVEGDLTKDDSPADWTKGTEHLPDAKNRTGSIKRSQASWEDLRLYFFIEKFLPENRPGNAIDSKTGRSLKNSLKNIAHTEAVLGRGAPGAPPGLVDFWREYIRANMPSSCPD